MSEINAMEEDFDEITICEKPALYTPIRIDRNTVPKGYHLYELRHDDDCQGDVIQIARSIMVNHWGSIITRDEIALPDDGYLNVEPDCINYGVGDCMSMIGFAEKYPPRICKLGTVDRRLTKVTIQLDTEDSKSTAITEFYERLADIMGLDPDTTYFDCTKIHVSRNIQTNIFAVLDAESSDPCHTGMMWCLRGPKTFDELPDDTVELLDGFFRTQNETPLPFGVTITNFKEAA